MGRSIRLALVQMSPTESLGDNLKTSLAMLESAAEAGAQVVGFPELQLSPFFPQYEHRDASAYALTLEDEAIHVLRSRCAELGVIAFPNVYLRQGNQTFDASLAIGADGELLDVAKMVHVVRAEHFFERDYYTPSDTGLRVVDTSLGKIAPVICFDRHFPESFRVCALRGAELIVVPTANVLGEDLELFEWEMRVAAMQNGVFVAMCNRVGVEGALRFSGGSIVVGPDGRVVARTGATEGLLLADLALEAIRTCRESRPYLALRRPEVFAELAVRP